MTPASTDAMVPADTKRPPDENHSVLQIWIFAIEIKI
jgi:hypothetical protein